MKMVPLKLTHVGLLTSLMVIFGYVWAKWNIFLQYATWCENSKKLLYPFGKMYVTNCVEQSQEAGSHSANQEIPCSLQSLKVRYCVHKSLTQMNPVQILPHYFPKIYFNIILPFMARSSNGLFSSDFVHICHLPHACYMPHPSHHPWF